MTSARLLTITPTRGRPDRAAGYLANWADTTTDDTDLLVCVDIDDPTLPAYLNLRDHYDTHPGIAWRIAPRARLVPTLNAAAAEHWDAYAWLGFLADDNHLPAGWDQWAIAGLRELRTGFVYGDDGIHGELLPTSFFVTTDIPRALGYVGPPCLTHLCLDVAVLALGQAAQCIRYLPGLRIRHDHPIAGRAPWDDTYREANSGEMEARDHAAYDRWATTDLAAAAGRIRALRVAA